MMRLTVLKLLVVAMLGGSTAQAAAPADPRMPVTAGPGETVFKAACAQCHLGQVPKAPTQVFLGMMEPEAIYAALTTGVMQSQAAALSAQDKQAVAGYLGDANLSRTGPAPAAPSCSGAAANFDLSQPPDVRNWGADLGNSHFVPAAAAGLAVADVPKLKLKWAFAFPGAIRARSQPSFAGGSLFVGSQNGTVYALDAASGCVRWTFKAGAEVRTAIAVSTWKAGDRAAKPQVFFGDLVGRAYSLDARTGQLLWSQKLEDHPSTTLTGAPTFYGGRVYFPVSSLEEAMADPKYPCCTFRGSLVALAATTGRVIWKTYTIAEKPRAVGQTTVGTPIFGPSGAAIWNSPTIDPKRQLVYVGTGDNYSAHATTRSDAILAFDLATGKMRWSLQGFTDDVWNVGCMLKNANCPEHAGPDFDIGAGTMLVKTSAGKERLYAGLKSGEVLAVDPQTHDRVLWRRRLGRGSTQGGIQFGMAYDGLHVYAPIADLGPVVDPNYPGEPHPGIYAVDPMNGDLVWSHPAPDRCHGDKFCDPGIIAAITAIPGAVFAGHMDGSLRAYASQTGAALWEYDTRADVTTLSGVVAHGGTIGGAGPVVYGGKLYAVSGYGAYFHLPGNVLLAFSVDGR
jgi:polyvinyl alcohol dehydrogenase (cytochrome)